MAHPGASLAEQRRSVKEDYDQPLEEGGVYHAVSADWFEAWGKHVDFHEKEGAGATPPPGPIDNEGLRDADFPLALRATASEGKDYVWLTRRSFSYLRSLYGLRGDAFERRAYVSVGDVLPRIDVRPQPVFVRVGCAVARGGMRDGRAARPRLGARCSGAARARRARWRTHAPRRSPAPPARR
jgi:hypothetical protein